MMRRLHVEKIFIENAGANDASQEAGKGPSATGLLTESG